MKYSLSTKFFFSVSLGVWSDSICHLAMSFYYFVNCNKIYVWCLMLKNFSIDFSLLVSLSILRHWWGLQTTYQTNMNSPTEFYWNCFSKTDPVRKLFGFMKHYKQIYDIWTPIRSFTSTRKVLNIDYNSLRWILYNLNAQNWNYINWNNIKVIRSEIIILFLNWSNIFVNGKRIITKDASISKIS